MKTSLAIQCIVLLACMAFCSSLGILRCRCLKNSRWVNPSLIADVEDFEISPYCNKRQVIVTLKNGRERCLDPESQFAKDLLRIMKQLKNGHKMTVSPKTITVSNSL